MTMPHAKLKIEVVYGFMMTQTTGIEEKSGCK